MKIFWFSLSLVILSATAAFAGGTSDDSENADEAVRIFDEVGWR